MATRSTKSSSDLFSYYIKLHNIIQKEKEKEKEKEKKTNKALDSNEIHNRAEI